MIQKIITKKKFYSLNSRAAVKMSRDYNLRKDASKILTHADKKYRWIHQAKWMDEPCLNLPEDMFALQEVVWKTKPDFIIETGIAWGGSILFGASLLKIFGGKKIIGIDTFIPKNVVKALNKNKKLLKFIKIIKGDSTDIKTIKIIKKIISNSKKVLVVLDSDHTHDHVTKELLIYSKFVSKGNYLICGDTIVEFIPKQTHRPRAWGPGNNPYTALKKFLKLKKNRFKIDRQLCNKLLFTNHPNGYLFAKR
jgi:cephalosporin hydroxylase